MFIRVSPYTKDQLQPNPSRWNRVRHRICSQRSYGTGLRLIRSSMQPTIALVIVVLTHGSLSAQRADAAVDADAGPAHERDGFRASSLHRAMTSGMRKQVQIRRLSAS